VAASTKGLRSRRAPGRRVERFETLDDDIIEEFLPIYQEAFRPLATRAPARQWLTEDEFRHEMRNPSVVKFVARDTSGDAVAMSHMATDLSTVPWISEPFFEVNFPQAYLAKKLWYFGSLLVRTDKQGGPWISFIVHDIFRYLDENGAVAAFDCCGFNDRVMRLPELLERASRRVAAFELREVDVQRYYVFTQGNR
jgi:hypothetical protein